MPDRLHITQLSPITQACLLLSMLSGVILGVVAFRHSHPFEAAADVHIAQALQQIRRHYVEDIDETTLARGAIDGILGQLDHYSTLLDQAQFEQLQKDAEGSFTGIGIEVDSQDGRFTVIAPMDDSPAYHAGIKAGDRLTNVDGTATEGIDINQLLNLIKGKAGTTVAVTVNRAPNEQLTFEIERARLSIDSVRVRPLEQGLVYARITRFNQNTAAELANALTESAQTQPVKGLVLDVRNNPGGLLSSAIAVADLFLARGVIVTTRKQRGEQAQQAFRATLEDILPNKPIAVLINAGSASASEVVAAALRDHQRAVLVGTRSYGKGSVQTIMPSLGLNQAIKLTTAEYFSPGGKAINQIGIEADIPIDPETEPVDTEDPWSAAAIIALSKGI
ncbi:MAG: S41 family peptidase [Pseudomonadota bacterium]|nr:S41 family peptidase [Pseudomonadota bacterium]